MALCSQHPLQQADLEVLLKKNIAKLDIAQKYNHYRLSNACFGGLMWYLGIGSIRHLPESTHNLIIDLAECLARGGYRLRCGGRGDVDDAFWKGADNLPLTQKHMLLPVKHFRGYTVGKTPEISSFDNFSAEQRAAATRACALPASKRKYHSAIKRAMDDVCVPLVMGCDMYTPVRFAITYAPGEAHTPTAITDIGRSSDPIYNTPDAAAFYLLKQMKIPVFNLANTEHVQRIVNYVNTQRYEVV